MCVCVCVCVNKCGVMWRGAPESLPFSCPPPFPSAVLTCPPPPLAPAGLRL